MHYFLGCDTSLIDITKKEIYIKNGEFTTCSPQNPTWKVKFKEFKIENQTVKVKGVTFYYKNIPLAYLPKIERKLKKTKGKNEVELSIPFKISYYDHDLEIYYYLNYKQNRLKAEWGIFFLPLHLDTGLKYNVNYYCFLNLGFNFRHTIFSDDTSLNVYAQKGYKNLSLLITYDFEDINYYVSYKFKIDSKTDYDSKQKREVYFIPTYNLKTREFSSLKFIFDLENECSKMIYYIDVINLNFGIDFSIKI